MASGCLDRMWFDPGCALGWWCRVHQEDHIQYLYKYICGYWLKIYIARKNLDWARQNKYSYLDAEEIH